MHFLHSQSAGASLFQLYRFRMGTVSLARSALPAKLACRAPTEQLAPLPSKRARIARLPGGPKRQLITRRFLPIHHISIICAIPAKSSQATDTLPTFPVEFYTSSPNTGSKARAKLARHRNRLTMIIAIKRSFFLYKLDICDYPGA